MRPDLLLRMLADETGEQLFALDLTAAAAWTAREPRSQQDAPKKVAILPLQGVLSPRGVRFFGMQLTPGMNTFRAALAQAVANPDVGAIVLDVDSPGGTVAGTPETAQAIKDAAAAKPLVAMVDSLCASAAYWSVSGARAIWAQPSAELGSIGVMATHLDHSGMLDKEGVKPTIIRSKSATYKAEGNPLEPLSEDAIAYLQSRADEQEDAFVAAIAAGRKTPADTVRETYGKGRVMSAQNALAAGMIDRVGTMAELLGSLHTQAGTVRRRFSALAFD